MTPTDAARQLLALEAKATPLPWTLFPAEPDNFFGRREAVVSHRKNDVGTALGRFVPWASDDGGNADGDFITFARNHGPAIARALLAAEERNAALEGALRQIRELTEDYEHNQQLSEVWYVADKALTPEGGGK